MQEVTTAAQVAAGLARGEDVFVMPAWVPPPVRIDMLDVIADHAARDPRIVILAHRLAMCAHRERCSPSQIVQRLMDAIEPLITYEDGPDYEMFQSVPYTLFSGLGQGVSPLTGERRGIGRCSHRTAVFVALCRALGINAKAHWFQQDGGNRNHVAAWVCDGGRARANFGGCTVAEVTIPGAIFGESPYDALARIGDVHGVNSSRL